ncbi:MAG: acyltransferase family protein [Parvularculaceae bacterium]
MGGPMPDRRTVLSIQYLRAVAAILVVIFHASDNAFSIGMSGVDIFFVISGFIMWTTTIAAGTSPQTFMERRLIRIVPLYWAMTLFTAFISLSPPSLGLGYDVAYLVRSLLFLPSDVSIPGHPLLLVPVLQVGWTLNLEMFFYAVFALGLFLPPRARLWFVGAAISTPVFLGLVVGDRLPVALRFYTRPELLEFVAGVLLGAAYAHGRSPKGAAPAVLLCAGAVILAAAGQPALNFRALDWGLPALMLCAGALAFEDGLHRRPSVLMKLLGDASYSIYLVHIPMLAVLRKLFGWSAGGPFDAGRTLTLTALASAGCVAVYFLFEKPVDRALRARLLKRRAPRPGLSQDA